MRRSTAGESLRASDRERLARMPASERVELALALGRRDLESYAVARGLSLAEARRELERRRQARRTPSACIEALLARSLDEK